MKLFKKNMAVDFDPEFSIVQIDNGDSSVLSIRLNSGDANPASKNWKVKADQVTRLSLVLDGFDEVVNGFVSGRAAMTINDDHEDNIVLCDNKIAIPSNMQLEEARNQIFEIWNDEFSNAITDYNESLGDYGLRSKPKSSKKDKIVNVVCIGVIVLSALFLIINKFVKPGTTQQDQQTVLNEIEQATSEEPEISVNESTNINQTSDPKDEALQEFGLEKGIDLNTN